ncbi:hypothetical protein GQ44DRAFT_606932 [Phaeosphaeriaceae sp. PMI808]|nr:hypothetical protein GQ44DRAFT_606932 [Phaeosphaeriaceae sp. PMI808]
MRCLSNLQKCVVTVTLITLYLLYQERSTGFDSATYSVWQITADRIVVFGDDWSDTFDAAQHPGRGEVWIETFCAELGCELIDNFAHSRPRNLDEGGAIPVIDADVHSQAMTQGINDGALIDLKTQVQQFLTAEKEKLLIPRILRPSDNWTVFTVFFGLWDLLAYSTLEVEPAMQAIDSSIAVLFDQLDLIATHFSNPMKVVLPRMVDPTFLPLFKPTKNDTTGRFAQMQHQQVFLSAYWNTVLLKSAMQWQNGKVFMPDPGAVVLEQTRAKQLHAQGISDVYGADRPTPLVQNVEQPCLIMLLDSNKTSLQAAAAEECSDPDAHLFWDHIKLGSIAMQLIGRQAASLVCNNRTLIDQTTHGPTYGYRPEQQEGERFNPKIPPGY